MKVISSKTGLIIVSIIIFFSAVMLFLLFSDDFKGSEHIVHQEGLIAKISKSILLNKDVTLNKDELNMLVQNEFKKLPLYSQNIKSFVLIPSQSEDIMYVYIRFKIFNHTLGFNAKTKVDLAKNKFEAEVVEAHIGKLPVPLKMVLKYINNKAEDSLKVIGHKMYFSSDINIKIVNANIKLIFEKFKIRDNEVTAKLKAKGDLKIPDLINKYI